MIGNLARRSGQTENEAVQQTDFRTRRTPATLDLCVLYESPRSRRWYAMLPRMNENVGFRFSPRKALARKRSAAAGSRLADRRKSIVAPLESTARYKYAHLPFTRM